jgi:hypothetical protein
VIAASRLRFQISNLRFEIRIEKAKERKVRTPKGSEPANGGASTRKNSRFQIPNGKRTRNRGGDDKCNREQTSRGLA